MIDNYEIEKTLVLSTSHIPEHEGDLLEAAGNPEDYDAVVGHSVDNYGYGWRIHVPDRPEYDDLDDVPYTKKLVALARKLGCHWLRLDQDAGVRDDLPTEFSPLHQLANEAD
jgi:hypothetical protein